MSKKHRRVFSRFLMQFSSDLFIDGTISLPSLFCFLSIFHSNELIHNKICVTHESIGDHHSIIKWFYDNCKESQSGRLSMSSNANCHHFDLKQSEGYQDFRANVPLKRISVDSDDPQKVRTHSYQIHTLQVYNVHVCISYFRRGKYLIAEAKKSHALWCAFLRSPDRRTSSTSNA